MKNRNFLAFDFGATSGRAILGQVGQTITLQEMHRFDNPHTEIGGRFYWDILHLYRSMIQGMQNTANAGFKDLDGMAIDTWGVDFGFLDQAGRLIANPVMYRDPRTQGMMETVFKEMPRSEIYGETGCQFMELNSLYQLYSMVHEDNPVLKTAESMLFMPDLLAYFLTGEKAWEYTIASTSQMINAETQTWSGAIFDRLGFDQTLVGRIQYPGTVLGQLKPSIQTSTGLNAADVLLTAGHDTASAVASVPAEGDDWAYLSSGTWSLIGIESEKPLISELSAKYNFTNEGGAGGRIRFLRNVAGMWLLEECRRVWRKEGQETHYDSLLEQAQSAEAFASLINPDDSLFMLPESMPAAIQSFCRKTDQAVPQTHGEFVRCIFESLAMRYAMVLRQIEEINGRPLKRLHIIGGGSQNQLLNQWAANATGLEVIAGPVEATAIGNVMMQAIGKGVIQSIEEGREIVRRSFELHHYQPEHRTVWQAQTERFGALFHSSR